LRTGRAAKCFVEAERQTNEEREAADEESALREEAETLRHVERIVDEEEEERAARRRDLKRQREFDKDCDRQNP
jgi:hypothetical protein